MFSFSRLSTKDIFVDINESDFKSIVFHLLRNSRFSRKKEAFKKILERENLGTTALGNNVAIPHCRLNNFQGFYLKFALFKEKLGYVAENKDEVRFMFLVVGSQNKPGYYLRALSHIVQVVKKPIVRDNLLRTKTKGQIRDMLCSYESELFEQKVCRWK